MDSFAQLYLVGDRMLGYRYQIGGGGEGGPDMAPNCPRCASSNTKFCYYNNYSLSQPRFLCKSCRRYWTKGGSLRNVPIGGGCRKSRRTKAARTSAMRHNSLSAVGDGLSSDLISGNESSAGAAEIDMATVFAKFLNQSSSCSTQYEDDPDADPIPNDILAEEMKFEEVAQIQEGLMENDENTFVIPDLVGQGDLLWSDSMSTSDLPDFMWQPENPFPSDEYWKVSTNTMIGDNWSSGFDFPGFEVLSRP